MQSKLHFIFIALTCLTVGFSCKQQQIQPWILFETEEGKYGYLDPAGDTMIAAGKYLMCFTDTLESFGIVVDRDRGMIGINQSEEMLFEVFSYDNGPDYISEGLFRIILNGKIGYANEKGDIVIQPEFSCAYPFQNGKARVSFQCNYKAGGEHSGWESESWFFINAEGMIIE